MSTSAAHVSRFATIADARQASAACINGSTAIAGMVVDIPHVLYDATPWRRWLLRLIHHLGFVADYATFYQIWDREYLADVCRGRREATEAFQSFLLARGLSWAQVDEVEAASRIQQQRLEQAMRPWPGVVKTIEKLAERGLPIVAWADAPCPSATLVQRLRRLGLGHCFQAVLSSFDLECTQPSPHCYQAALKALDLKAEEVAYVGHDAVYLRAAQTAGLQTVAFNYNCGAMADLHLARFEDLLAISTRGQVR